MNDSDLTGQRAIDQRPPFFARGRRPAAFVTYAACDGDQPASSLRSAEAVCVSACCRRAVAISARSDWASCSRRANIQRTNVVTAT